MALELGDQTFTIPVPHPTLKLALTPHRESDGSAVVPAFNHPSIYMNLNNPPFPYTEKDWIDWFANIRKIYEENLASLPVIRSEQQSPELSDDWEKRKWIGRWHSPIRDISDDITAPGAGKFIGDIGVARQTFMHIVDPEEQQKLKAENDSLSRGDPRIKWMIGYWLIPEYQGRGIMTCVLKTVLAEIIVPYMNGHIVEGGYLEHNPASRRVFEKCGFSFVSMTADAMTINPTKVNGREGQKVGLGLLNWEREVFT